MPAHQSRAEKVAIVDDGSKAGFSQLDPDLTLAKVGRDLTWEVLEDRVSPVFDRDAEIRRLVKLLCRRSAKNVVVTGPSGVGKTALIEGLAHQITSGRVPRQLEGKRVIQTSFLDMWMYAGDSDNWAKYGRILKDVLRESEEVGAILFMDEIHTIFGHGYSMSYLRPHLARGTLTVIGATTDQEYGAFIERDRGTSRRFQVLRLEEPDDQVTIRILKQIMPTIRDSYGCGIDDDETLAYLLNLSNAYVPYEAQPSKAINILDQLAAEQAVDGRSQGITRDDVRRAVCEIVNLPEDAVAAPLELLDGMERYLNSQVLGQEGAVSRLCKRLLVSKARLTVTPERPHGVFLLAGPTGVGKTELAKALARYLTGHEKNLVRLDMSAYSTPSSVHALIGFAGEQSTDTVQHLPYLTRLLRANPYGVLLLDEIEKADPQVRLLFLQALDAGRLVDALGNEIYLRNMVIMMTCNVGYSARKAVIAVPGADGRERQLEIERAVMASIDAVFPREFLGRVDDVLFFKPLTPELMQTFVGQKIRTLEGLTGKTIQVTEDAIRVLCEKGFSTEYGARGLNRAVDETLGCPLARIRLSAGWEDVGSIRVEVDAGGRDLTVVPLKRTKRKRPRR